MNMVTTTSVVGTDIFTLTQTLYLRLLTLTHGFIYILKLSVDRLTEGLFIPVKDE